MKKVYILEETELNQIITDAVIEALTLFTQSKHDRKEEKLSTTNEACEELSWSELILNDWKKRGYRPLARIGDIRYKESDLNNLTDKRNAK